MKSRWWKKGGEDLRPQTAFRWTNYIKTIARCSFDRMF